VNRYILTGAPGSGKTAIIRRLEHDGYTVVEESATDVIALEQAQGTPEPWTRPDFVTAVADLQRKRQLHAAGLPGDVQFFDRSPICTHALSTYLGHPVPPALSREIERMEAEDIYQKKVFFIQNMGFITPTEARQISFPESLRFERVHEAAYHAFGYECLHIAPGALPHRAEAIKRYISPR
jgi:predicted ATPase